MNLKSDLIICVQVANSSVATETKKVENSSVAMETDRISNASVGSGTEAVFTAEADTNTAEKGLYTYNTKICLKEGWDLSFYLPHRCFNLSTSSRQDSRPPLFIPPT